MPVAVAEVRLGAVGLGVKPRLVAILLDERAAFRSSHMEQELVCAATVGGVAVHALSRHRRLLQDGKLAETVEVTLVNADVAAHLVAWGDAAVGEAEVV